MDIYDIDLLMLAFLILLGYWMFAFPPKKINGLAGYRTRRSMLNLDNWNYANKTCGKSWMRISLLLFSMMILSKSITWSDQDTVLLVHVYGSLIVYMLPIFWIEHQLKQRKS